MIRKDNIKSAFNVNIAISNEMATAIDTWVKIYRNNAEWHNEKTKSLKLGKAISQEFARLVTIEMKSELTGSKRAEYLTETYKNVLKDLRKNVEYMCAKGAIVFKPYVSNGKIVVDYVQADKFYPTEYDSNGKLTAGVFLAQKIIGEKIHTRLEYHRFSVSNNIGMYTITNKAFVSDNKGELGTETSLGIIQEWANIEEIVTINNVEKPLFIYIKVPTANNIDEESPLGISVFANATDLIKDADEQYARYKWEFEGTEVAIEVDETSLRKDENGNEKLSKHDKRLYKKRNTGDAGFWEIFSPDIREVSQSAGLNKIFRLIEFHCQLAYGTLSDPNDVDKTAEEIKTSKQRSYSTVADIQKSVQQGLEELIYVLDVLATLYSLAPQGKAEASFEWDDSIVTDRAKEYAEKMQMVTNGTMPKWEFRMWYFGETKEQAKLMIEIEKNTLFDDTTEE